MHDQSIEEVSEARMSDDARDSAVLYRMLSDFPSFPWTVVELGREINDPLDAEDAVCRLVATGLAHRTGEFVWPTRSARRAHEIQTGSV
jgi:hypothetical protein